MLESACTIIATLAILYVISPTLRADITATIAKVKEMIPTKKS